jgi:hypothetical protein
MHGLSVTWFAGSSPKSGFLYSPCNACDQVLVAGLCGTSFDFCDLPASNTSGGILLAWDRDL